MSLAVANDSTDRIHPRRASTACQRCRKRKTKCLGGNPCRACALAGQDCVYFKTPKKKILVSQSYLLELEARVNAYERESGSEDSAACHPQSLDDESTTMSEPPETQYTSPSSSECDNPLTENTAQLVSSPGGERQYLGASSSLSLGLRFRDFIGTLRKSLNNSLEIDPPRQSLLAHSTAGRKPRIACQEMIALPPFGLAKRLFASQYAYFGTTFFFADQKKFEENLQKMYVGKLDLTDKNDCLDYCQVLIILAFGQMYSINQWTNNDGPPGFDYFQQAIGFLPDIYEQGSMAFVEVLSLTAWFFQNLNRRDAAFLYIGLALRMAVSLGLHQEVSDQNYDAAAREYRRRLWWSVYSMDRILCIKFGNPPMIADEDIGVLLPSKLKDEPDTCPAIALRHYTELSMILSKIVKTLYRRVQPPKYNLVKSVQSILADLSRWDTNLPQHLRFDFIKADQAISREVVSIYLHYSQCINMAARPLVFHVVRTRLQGQGNVDRTDWTAGLSRATVTIINACIAATRNTVIVMTRAANQNLIATYGYQDAEHAFSAALILVMINIALPYNSYDRKFMWMALEVLEGMAEKGSDHVGYLHNLLISLCTAMDLGRPNKTSTDNDSHIQTPRSSDFAAILPQPDLASESGDFQTGDDLMWGETVTNDPNFWWEGYGILDINKI